MTLIIEHREAFKIARWTQFKMLSTEVTHEFMKTNIVLVKIQMLGKRFITLSSFKK